MSESTIKIEIDGCVTGDITITGECVIIHVSGDCEGSITVQQVPLSNPDNMLVEIGGERVLPAHLEDGDSPG